MNRKSQKLNKSPYLEDKRSLPALKSKISKAKHFEEKIELRYLDKDSSQKTQILSSSRKLSSNDSSDIHSESWGIEELPSFYLSESNSEITDLGISKPIRKRKKPRITRRKFLRVSQKIEKNKKKFLKPRCGVEKIITENSKKYEASSKRKMLKLDWLEIQNDKRMRQRIYRAKLDRAFNLNDAKVIPIEELPTKINLKLIDEESCFSSFPTNFASLVEPPKRSYHLPGVDSSNGARETGFWGVLRTLRASKKVNVDGAYQVMGTANTLKELQLTIN